jgi:hypothetical protein
MISPYNYDGKFELPVLLFIISFIGKEWYKSSYVSQKA